MTLSEIRWHTQTIIVIDGSKNIDSILNENLSHLYLYLKIFSVTTNACAGDAQQSIDTFGDSTPFMTTVLPADPVLLSGDLPSNCSAEVLAALSPRDWEIVIEAEAVKAAQWMVKSAGLGNADAQVVLGQWLLNGHGLQRNAEQAVHWFFKAAAQGHPMATNMVGRCFENGWGVEINHFAAANWFRQVAHKGLDAGMYNYANLLATGKGVKKDAAAALQWYREAAAQGHAKSMTKIGYFYEDGRVVEKDMDAAMAWFERGARGGDFRGQFNYAGMLAAQGKVGAALHWLRKMPLTATPAYLQLSAKLLLQSPHPTIQALGRDMLASQKIVSSLVAG